MLQLMLKAKNAIEKRQQLKLGDIRALQRPLATILTTYVTLNLNITTF